VTKDFSGFDAVLLDLDGTIYFEDDPLPGARDLIATLQRQKIKFACISNSTTSPDRVVKRLAGMEISVSPEQIFTAGAAALDYVVNKFPRPGGPRAFNLATQGVQDMLRGRGVWVQSESEPCDAVIVGAPANRFADFDRQRIALGLLKKGALAVGVCADRIYPSPRGLEFGSGALTLMLSYAADVQPVYCGKPEKIFFAELCHKIGARAEKCVLVGDNLESDIWGAKRMGMKTILTLTGVTRREDLKTAAPDRRPDEVVTDLRELL
jgi:HAD superfamily hydrolase (TIGR01450 family)